MISRYILIACAALLAACTAPRPEDVLPALEGDWSITLSRSGGIAGMNHSVTVTADGNVTAMDLRTGQTGTLQLSEADLSDLQAAVLAAQITGPTGTETGCADCFLYQLDVNSPAGNYSVTLDDVTLAESGLQPLITRLLELMEQALQQ